MERGAGSASREGVRSVQGARCGVPGAGCEVQGIIGCKV